MADQLDRYQFFWCGWTVPEEVPMEHRLESWPPGMQGWASGWGDGYSTWVGMIWAETPAEAWEVILTCYGASKDDIESRWIPVPKGTEPALTDRFPGFEPEALKEAARKLYAEA